ncbi:MAG TPA: hypothetical protein VMW16_15460 [Sedimentisphaerales bacterium]|nr:hypothetical protein [Sedimentisphaerales bacterium]
MATTAVLGLAGEYAVAAELCRQDIYCQLTLRNHKRTDLLADTGDQVYRISVKTKQKQKWPKIKGIWRKGELLVFVDYRSKEQSSPPDFYVLNVSAWKKVVARIKKRVNDSRTKIDDENTLYWPASKGKNNGWVGCEVQIEDVIDYKDAWPTKR